MAAIIQFFLAALAIVVYAWAAGGMETTSLGGRLFAVQLSRLICDAALLLLPYWWLPRRWRWLLLIPVFIIPLWTVGGLMYFRFWGDLPGLSSLGLAGNLNSELLGSTTALWRPKDIVIILLPFILLTVYCCGWRRRICASPLTLRSKIMATAGSILLFIGGQFLCSYSMYKGSRANHFDESLTDVTRQRLTDPIFMQTHDLAVNGRMVHFFKSLPVLYKMMNIHIELSEEENRHISDFITSSQYPTFPGDTLLESNRNKNLILILVESLNSYVIDLDVDRHAVAPVLRSLRDSEGTVSALDIATQVRTGGSGDGQLIANTGLLPLPDLSTAIALGSTVTFPSLCRALSGHENIVVFGDDASTWNERSTFAGYGFDRIVTNKDYPHLAEHLGGDAALFAMADSLVGTLRQPFFMELLTVSMHVPFQDSRIPDNLRADWLSEASGLPEVERNYLEMVNYFDTALGGFIGSLKERGLYDDTIIVIVSDHAQELALSAADGAADITTVPMTFMAINTGITRSVTRDCGQIDVYPTILQLMNHPGWRGWKGVGHSMLYTTPPSAPTPDEASTLSETILRSDWFSHP